MANTGKLAIGVTAVGVQDIYTFTGGIALATYSLDLENTTNSDVTVKVHISAGATPVPGDRMAYFVIPANGHAELNCKVASAGEHVILDASAAGVDYRLSGVEQVTL